MVEEMVRGGIPPGWNGAKLLSRADRRNVAVKRRTGAAVAKLQQEVCSLLTRSRRRMPRISAPSPEALRAAEGRTLPDVIAPGLDVLFCGINPGLYTAAVGHHFARPGNRFWPALHAAGFTDRVLRPDEEQALLAAGCGITNVVQRATAAAAELSRDELRGGARALAQRVREHEPRWLAVLGVGAYRTGFGEPKAQLGRQARAIGSTGIWVLPNPSGLNASYRPADFARLFGELREAVTMK